VGFVSRRSCGRVGGDTGNREQVIGIQAKGTQAIGIRMTDTDDRDADDRNADDRDADDRDTSGGETGKWVRVTVIWGIRRV